MNKLITIAITVLILGSMSFNKSKKEITTQIMTSNKELVSELILLNEDKNYFELQVQFNHRKDELSQLHIYFFEAILNNVFNNPTTSNIAIDKIIKSKSVTLEDSLLKKLYYKKQNNHERLFEYDAAAKTLSEMREKFKPILDSLEDADLENNYNFYNPLRSISKQELIIPNDVTIPLERDVASLLNVDAFFTEQKINMVFDTGANFSVIRKSYVDKLGMKLIESDFSVDSATGIKVKSELALAEEFKIGEITIKNAIFMVLKDEDLSFTQVPGGYDIYGIIGFPIIEAMKEVHFLKGNELFIPKEPTQYNLNNLAIDGLIPIIKATYKDDILPFQLDTGAQKTSMYNTFYEKYRAEIEANNERIKFGAGGAGGVVVYDGYIMNGIVLKIADTEATLNNSQIHIDKISKDKGGLFGNLGQDYIQQFDKMILSFENSSIVFQ